MLRQPQCRRAGTRPSRSQAAIQETAQAGRSRHTQPAEHHREEAAAIVPPPSAILSASFKPHRPGQTGTYFTFRELGRRSKAPGAYLHETEFDVGVAASSQPAVSAPTESLTQVNGSGLTR